MSTSVPINSIQGLSGDNMTVGTLIASSLTCTAGFTTTTGTVYAPASDMVANTAFIGNGITISSGNVFANASALTCASLAVGNNASMGNNMVIGTYTTRYTTLTLQANGNGAGNGAGTTCQILANPGTDPGANASAASVAFIDNGSNSASITMSTKTSNIKSNPLVSRFSVTDTTATVTLPALHVAGTLATPSVNFTGETGTGMYGASTGNVCLTSQGVASAYMTSQGVLVPGNISVANASIQNAVMWSKAPQTLTTTQYTSAPTSYTTSNNSPANITATGIITLTQNIGGQGDLVGYTISTLKPGTPFTIQMDYNYVGSADGFCLQLWYSNAGGLGTNCGRPVSNYASGYRFTYNLYNINGISPGIYFMQNASASGTSVILANSTVTLPSNVWCTYSWQFDGMSTWNIKVSNASNTSQVFLSNVIVDSQALGIWQAATNQNTLQIQAATGGSSALQLMRNLSFTTSPGNINFTQTGFGTSLNSNALILTQGASVGIGTSAPTSDVYVVGNAILGTMTYGNVTSGSGALPANSTTVANGSSLSANSVTLGNVSVVGLSTLKNITFSGKIVPSASTSIQWQGAANVAMLEVYYGSGDRYGLAQYTNGTLTPLRLYTSYSYTPASILLGKYSTTAGPVSTDWVVCNSSGIYNQTQLTLTSNSIAYTGGANTQTIADRSGTFGSYAAAAQLNFPAFSGLVLVHNANAGGVSMFLVGGNSATCVANSSSTSNTGAFVANATVAGYTWTNTSGATANASFTAIRTNVTK